MVRPGFDRPCALETELLPALCGHASAFITPRHSTWNVAEVEDQSVVLRLHRRSRDLNPTLPFVPFLHAIGPDGLILPRVRETEKLRGTVVALHDIPLVVISPADVLEGRRQSQVAVNARRELVELPRENRVGLLVTGANQPGQAR